MRRLVTAVVAALVVGVVPAVAQPAREDVVLPPAPVAWTDEPPASWPAPPPASATAYVLLDADTGQVLATRNPDDRRIVASTIKLLTVMTALEMLDVDDEVVVDAAADVGGAGTSVDPGETRTVRQLVDAVLVRSGNDAALALAAAASDGDLDAFVDEMQATAADLGLDGATIVEPTGLDDANRLSARDLAVLGRVALADDRVRASAGQAEVVVPDLGVQENRNLLVGEYDGATGLKTGFTDLAGYCLVASAEREGRELVAVVLGAREDPARFDEAAALLDHGFGTLVAEDWDQLRARGPGAWSDLLAGGRVWGHEDAVPAIDLGGDGDTLRLQARAGDDVLGSAVVDVPQGSADGLGARLAEAVYTTMRRAHVVDAWPDDTSGAGTDGSSSG